MWYGGPGNVDMAYLLQIAWYNTQLMQPFQTNTKADNVAVKVLWREYGDGQARIKRELKKSAKVCAGLCSTNILQ